MLGILLCSIQKYSQKKYFSLCFTNKMKQNSNIYKADSEFKFSRASTFIKSNFHDGLPKIGKYHY